MRWITPIVCFALLLTACAEGAFEDVPAAGISTVEGTLLDGSPEAVGVLSLLNDSSTDMHSLDVSARLDRRAARNLIAFRDGDDGVRYTADDRSFESVVQVDRVRWVGPSALAKLVAYADSLGYVPRAGDVLGVFDNVAFTVEQADAVLVLVNTASEPELDHDVRLNSRAVKSIVEARPIGTLAELAGLYYVGQSAMLRMREYEAPIVVEPEPAPEPEPEPTTGFAAGEDCAYHAECADGLRCFGHPNDGSSDFGMCVDTTRLPGQDMPCDRFNPCEGEMQCAGYTLWGEGYCVAPWMAGRFVNDQWYQIRDSEVPWDCGDRCPSVSSSVVVRGLATVPVDIIVTAQIDHADGRDLRVTLTDPNGDQAVLWDNSDEVGNGVSRSFVTTGISRDDYVNGRWTLTIEDTEHGGAGWLKGWDLFIVSRWD